MVRIGVADTTFSRVDMGVIAERKLRSLDPAAQLFRFTVPGVKDLPLTCQRLFTEEHCDIVVACGMVGAAEVDKVCGHEASTAIQQVQLAQGKHILEVFIHMDEATDDADLITLTTNRVEKHCENAIAMLKGKTTLIPHAGTGRRQGRADAGAAEMVRENSPRVGFVVADFNREITNVMETAAKQCAQQHGMLIITTHHVYGSFDVPLAVQRLLKRNDIDVVCVYGAIIKGETDHDRVIGHTTAKTLQELSLKHHKPVALGIAGPGMTDEQAAARAEEYGKRAVKAALQLWKEVR